MTDQLDTEIEGEPANIREVSRWVGTDLGGGLDTMATEVGNHRRDVAGDWQGEAADGFAGRAQTLVRKTDEGVTISRAVATVLDTLADELRDAKQDMAEVRSTARDGDLTVTGFVIVKPGPQPPSAGDLPADATPQESDSWHRRNDAVIAYNAQIDVWNSCVTLSDEAFQRWLDALEAAGNAWETHDSQYVGLPPSCSRPAPSSSSSGGRTRSWSGRWTTCCCAPSSCGTTRPPWSSGRSFRGGSCALLRPAGAGRPPRRGPSVRTSPTPQLGDPARRHPRLLGARRPGGGLRHPLRLGGGGRDAGHRVPTPSRRSLRSPPVRHRARPWVASSARSSPFPVWARPQVSSSVPSSARSWAPSPPAPSTASSTPVPTPWETGATPSSTVRGDRRDVRLDR